MVQIQWITASVLGAIVLTLRHHTLRCFLRDEFARETWACLIIMWCLRKEKSRLLDVICVKYDACIKKDSDIMSFEAFVIGSRR